MGLKIAEPLVLLLLDTADSWSRGVLCGFAASARERGWELVHYPSSVDLAWALSQWTPAAVVFGSDTPASAVAHLSAIPAVSVNLDRSAAGISSVVVDDDELGKLAVAHFSARGLKDVTTFRLDDHPVASSRERAFLRAARKAELHVAPSYPIAPEDSPSPHSEDRARLTAWLQSLPKPCGLFACSDRVGRIVARHTRAARVRVPEDLALLGCENDPMECELLAPPLSSIAIPWLAVGRAAADIVQDILAGKEVTGERVVLAPLEVVARRSSDVFAVDDEIVAEAVSWIYANVSDRITVPMVARAVGSGRQRLERRFRACLGRTIHDEVRRARVEVAKRALSTTSLGLHHVAEESGFSSAALLSIAFQKEVGMPPGAYRRRAQGTLGADVRPSSAPPADSAQKDENTSQSIFGANAGQP